MDHNEQLSGLDLLFGALGATLFLYILIMSMAGVPKKKGLPVHRVYNWEFVLSDEAPIEAELFLTEIWDKGKEQNPPVPKICLQKLMCESGSSKPVSVSTLGQITTSLEEIPGIAPKKKLKVELILALNDNNWLNYLELDLHSVTWEKASFSIFPGSQTEERVNTNRTNITRFYCSSKLKEIGDGYMPEILLFEVIQ